MIDEGEGFHDADPDAPPPFQRIPVEDALSGLVRAARDVGNRVRARIPTLLDVPAGVFGDVGRTGALVGTALWALRLLARRGSTVAQSELGYRLANGDGAPHDPEEAFQWFRQAARIGDAASQYALGVMYATGQGVDESKLKAAMWYLKAAEQGHAVAQFNLALLYEGGEGVARDSVKALAWYLRAAEQDYPRALFNLGVLVDRGEAADADLEPALAYYRRAAEKGFAPAQLRVAQAGLEDGPPADAWFWFSVAALTLPAGEAWDQAQAGRDAAYQRMSLAEIESARQRLRDWRAGG